MTLTDANVLMYAAGADHPNKAVAVEFLGEVAAGKKDSVIDAELLQEILHRYRALNRWDDGQRVYDLARRLFPDVLSITAEVMDEAKRILDSTEAITARDAVHAAVVSVYKLEGIYTFDSDFERIPGCRCLRLQHFRQ